MSICKEFKTIVETRCPECGEKYILTNPKSIKNLEKGFKVACPVCSGRIENGKKVD